jgi:hypothetical protein
MEAGRTASTASAGELLTTLEDYTTTASPTLTASALCLAHSRA